jgi:hypothetical protein
MPESLEGNSSYSEKVGRVQKEHHPKKQKGFEDKRNFTQVRNNEETIQKK